jgi:O-methyltransferase involved in polyketide biosynthesis
MMLQPRDHCFSRETRRGTLICVTDYDFNRVSPTALIPASARGEHTDIPFAKEVVQFLRSKGRDLMDGPWGTRTITQYVAFFEARFKAIDHIVEENQATQVLELAAGLSTRGMEFARRGMEYVEADLPESIQLKEQVVTAVLGHIPANLHLCPVNVLDRAALLACCTAFANRPVAIATEGLLRYLTFDEKQQLAGGVHEILSRFGGFWVTTDIHLRKWTQHRRGQVNRQLEAERMGRDLNPNYFDDLEHARTFFESCGFAVESRPLLDGIREQVMSMPQASEELLAELEERRVFVLRVTVDFGANTGN